MKSVRKVRRLSLLSHMAATPAPSPAVAASAAAVVSASVPIPIYEADEQVGVTSAFGLTFSKGLPFLPVRNKRWQACCVIWTALGVFVVASVALGLWSVHSQSVAASASSDAADATRDASHVAADATREAAHVAADAAREAAHVAGSLQLLAALITANPAFAPLVVTHPALASLLAPQAPPPR